MCIITNSSNPVSLSGTYNLLRGDPLAGSLLWFWISAEFALKILLLSDFQSWGRNKPSKGAHPSSLSYYHEENIHETTSLLRGFRGYKDASQQCPSSVHRAIFTLPHLLLYMDRFPVRLSPTSRLSSFCANIYRSRELKHPLHTAVMVMLPLGPSLSPTMPRLTSMRTELSSGW